MMNKPISLLTVIFLTACGTGFINKPILDTGSGDENSDEAGSDTDGGGSSSPSDTPTDPDDPDTTDDTATPGSHTISAAHPRIFFSPSDLPRLQAQVFDFERASLINRWDAIVTTWRSIGALPFPDGTSREYDTDDQWAHIAGPLPNLAMYALFTEDDEAQAQTAAWLRQVSDQEDWGTSDEPNIGRGATQTLQAMTIAYDMLHDKLEVEERVALRAKLIQQTGKLYRVLSGETPPEWAAQWNSRRAHSAHTALLMAGLAMEHDYDDAAVWLAQARAFVETTMHNLEDIEDGSWPDGPSIGSDTLTSLYQSLFLIERHFGTSWTDHPWLQQRSNAMLRSTLPGQSTVVALADGSQSWLRGPEHQACFSDRYAPSPIATWMAEQHSALEEQPSRRYELWIEFLWCDPAVLGLEPGPAEPSSHWFHQWNVGTWVSGHTWTDSSFSFGAAPPSPAVGWIDTSASARFNIANLHPSAGTISWHPKGQPVITSGGNQHPKRTALANTYTFSPLETVDRDWGTTDWGAWWSTDSFIAEVGNYARVGQRGEWDFDFGPPNDLIDAHAGMELVATRNGMTAMVGYFGGMYPIEYKSDAGWQDLGLQRLTRTILILPQEIILIFDHLEHNTDLVHHARFQSTGGTFSVGGTTGTISMSDGSMWSIDAPDGGGLTTGRHIQDVRRPDGPWINHMEVTNSAYAGKHDYVYVLRSSTQTVAVTKLSPPTAEPVEMTDTGAPVESEGVHGYEVRVDVASEGTTESYTIRIATSVDESEREAFLSFPGWIGVTAGTDAEIRF